MTKRIIGVTGGVGSGKSTVLSLLSKKFGFHNIYADQVAHKMQEPGNTVYCKIIELFGSEILLPDGYIDRSKLAGIVFNDSNSLKAINKIVHPAVKEAILQEIEVCDMENIAVEAALLIEAGYTDICSELWYVYADEETRIQRLMEGRGYSREKSENIIASQLSDYEFRKYCSVIIDNSNSIDDTLCQVEKILHEKRK